MSSEFVKAEERRVKISNAQQKRIKRMYREVLGDISERTKFLETRDNVSSVLRRQYLNELRREINENLDRVDKDTEQLIRTNMNSISQEVVRDNRRLLKKMGFTSPLRSVACSHVPEQVVNTIITGKLYQGRWTLSKAIWNDNARKKKELEYIVAKGVAEQRSTYEIAKDLEKYVNPSAVKDWDWSRVYPGVRKKVDYNAQRLARTMISHAYQESFVRVTKKNPFIEAYRWLPSNSDRVCPICIARGEDDSYGLGSGIFPKEQLPLDHPNGMCTFETVITKSYEEIADDLINWVAGTGDSKLNALLDSFAEDLLS